MEFAASAIIVIALLAGLIFGASSRRSIKLPPGPIGLPIVGSLLSLRQPLHRHFARLSEKYGPTVYLRIGMVPYVVANTAAAAEQFLRVHDADFAYRPMDESFFRIFSFDWRDLAFSPPSREWKNMRKICATHLFSTSMLNASAPSRRSQLQIAIDNILGRSRQGESVNLRHVLGRLSSGSLCLDLFGRECPEVLEAVSLLAEQAINLNIGDLIPALDWLDLHGIYARMTNEIMPRIKAMLDDHLREHRQRKQDAGDKFVCRDFVDVLISLDDKEKISDEAIMALLCDMLGAGFHTSKETIEWCMAEAISNSDVMRRAQEELDQVVGKGRAVRESDIPSLPFIQAILKEGLRLHPTVPLGVPHYNPHAVKLGDGTTIPAKTKLLINIWAVGRDPSHWTRPSEFLPERFLESSIVPGGQHFQLIPFSAGRRMCAGSALAMRSISFMLASLLHGFNWSAIPGRGIDLNEYKGNINCPPASELVVEASPRIKESVLERYEER